jgi:prevent-host-death family protein
MTVAAGAFKTRGLAIMDEVRTKRETVVITKRGHPVAKLVPVSTDVGHFWVFLGQRSHNRSPCFASAFSERVGQSVVILFMPLVAADDNIRRSKALCTIW